MKKRLRKKRHLGEFAEYGFKLRFAMTDGLSTSDRNLILDDFIFEIERLGLQFGGGGVADWEGFAALDSCGSATDEHRSAILAWLKSHPNIEKPDVGPLVDAWHGWD